MDGSRFLCRAPLALGLVVATAALSAVAAQARSSYTEREVIRAFGGAKIHLVKTLAGNESQYVTALTAVVPKKVTHAKPWAVAVWVYASKTLAREAFSSGVPQWRANGIASTRVGNLVVIVVPKGREIGSQAPPFPMPARVRSALKRLPH